MMPAGGRHAGEDAGGTKTERCGRDTAVPGH
jgi:hypothetical protein